jgi:2-keto-4-pentenoate hydratase/2-oxohepta-3-ene-1,7-dioic acid hydratase in catechol pathway
MQLVSYRLGDEPPRAGLDVNGQVYDLATAMGRSDGLTLSGVIRDWASYEAGVLAAAQRPGPAPVSGARIVIPVADPVRDAFAIGGNYRKHVEAAGSAIGVALNQRKAPTFFVKPTGAFIGPGEFIEFDPTYTTKVDYEVELGVVIGKGGRDISESDAMDHVLGFMVVNDVSARDLMLANKPQIDYFRGKGLDTFFPIGPGIVVRQWLGDHRGLALTLTVNGETRQSSSTDQMTRDVPEIIAQLSRSISLRPGDIIATGTPEGVAVEMENPRFLADGDVVVASVEGLGELTNTVRERRTGAASTNQ